MSFMSDYIVALIAKLVNDYYNSSRKRKILIVVLAGASFFMLISILFRSCSSPKPTVFKQSRLEPLSVVDANGNEWILDPLEGQLMSNLKTDTAKPGTPLVVKTNARVEAQDRVITFSILVQGQATEEYVGGVRKNGVWQPPPTFKIVNETGAVLFAGTFKYG